ncbi:glycosyl transferase [Kineosporia sp. NBRC 101677]|uniref:hypothetical protein n=1 Tax=Kineosporia sp. NBRC 101677 TaxID=3032197 RepID=UPI0024A1DDF1|nr:hypothetical protein [Kineosporia sp. NBRC 101677]GLY15300.1 glycosyl transferase [Kineosporia sp. NBRC 101677]
MIAVPTARRTGPESGSDQALPDAVNALLVTLALVALAFGVRATSGLWEAPGGRIIAPNTADAFHYTWWLGHTPHAISQGESPFFTRDMNWPTGVSAMNNTTLLLPAVLLFPVTWLAGPLVTLNLLNLLAVPLCFAGGYWALRRALGLPAGPAAIGAVCFAISPAVVNSLVGHITMSLAATLPVLIGLSVQAWRAEPTVSRPGVWLGLVALLQVFTGEEVLFQAGFGALLVALVAAVGRPRETRAGFGRLLRNLGVAFAVFLPVAAYPLYLQFLGPMKHHGSPFLLDYYAADLLGFTTQTSGLLLHSEAAAEQSSKFPGGIEEHLAFLGWPLIITGAAALVLGRRNLAICCAAVGLLVSGVLSLGAKIWVDGLQTDVRGPYWILQKLPVTEASLASRFGLLTVLFAAALLALAVHELRRVGYPFAAITAAVLCLLPLLPAKVTTVDAPQVPAYFTTAATQLPKGTNVLLLPYPWAGAAQTMYWQSAADYRFQMPGGYFLGPNERGEARISGAQPLPTGRMLLEVQRSGQIPALDEATRAQAQKDLQAWQSELIVLGPDNNHEALKQVVTYLLGRPPTQQGGVAVWDLR